MAGYSSRGTKLLAPNIHSVMAKAWFSLAYDGVGDDTGDGEYRAIGKPRYTCDGAARVWPS